MTSSTEAAPVAVPVRPVTPVPDALGPDSGEPTSRSGEGTAPDSGSRILPAFLKLFVGGFAGKLLGAVREVALAAAFGTGFGVGAFRAGQTATNALTHTFTGDTLNAGFIPLCSRYARQEPEKGQSLFWTLVVLLGGIGLVLALTLGMGAPFLARVLVPGFPPEAQSLTADMIRVMAAGTPFYVLAALFSYMEMANGRYLIASVRSSIQNIGLICGIGAAVWLSNPIYLAWGFSAYAVLFSTFGIATLVWNGIVRAPRAWAWSEAVSVAREFIGVVRPLLLLPLVFQASLVVERMVASLISPDVVPALDYAKFFSESGLALLAIPLGMAGLSELGRMDAEQARRSLERTLGVLLTFTVPVSLFLLVHGSALVSVTLGRGEFGPEAVHSTTLVLTGLAGGFWAQVTGYVLLKALSVQERNREVLQITVLASCAHIAVNLILYRTLGALSLGLAIGTYGLVLLTLAVKATDVLDVVKKTLGPLIGAGLVYVPIASLLQGDSPLAFAGAVLLATGFWTTFVMIIPGYREQVIELRRSMPGGAGDR